MGVTQRKAEWWSLLACCAAVGGDLVSSVKDGAMSVVGRRGVRLEEVWEQQGGPEAYKGTMVADFPNLFFLLGPNTALGHNSVVYMIECQVGMQPCRHERGQGGRWRAGG